jgi:hypothetical protein
MLITHYEYLKHEQLELTIRPCPSCGIPHKIIVDRHAYDKWAEGMATIEEAFPELSVEERELLLTGTDEECLKNAFPEKENEEDE